MEGVFSHRIQAGSVFFKHARGVSDRSGKEFHIYHELILLLDGEAEFISEQLHTAIKPGTLIVIPRESYHQVVIHGQAESYYRCVVQFDDMDDIILQARDVLLLQADKEIRYLFGKLMDAAKAASDGAESILKAVLVLLLDAIGTKKEQPAEVSPQNETVAAAVDYINQNLARPLTVGQIAQACNTSPSSLAHIFKREMYCSVHKFMVKKRLIHAHHRIAAGQAATVAAVECGFTDYSGFYKQYKKAFGHPPSQTGNT